MIKLSDLVNYYHEHTLAHAYLIETNNSEKCYQELLEVIKAINCPKSYKEKCQQCNICNLINNNYLPSFVVISPDGKNIKKEQILKLKKQFSTKPIYTKENIYILKNAEQLNGFSANTMLKFIEEPEDNIFGFLITDNLNNVITTIKSRCQLIKVKYPEDESEDLKYEESALKYLNVIKENTLKAIIYNKEIILKNFPEKEQIVNLLKALKKAYQKDVKNNFEIKKQVNIINNKLEKLYFNVNIEMLLDNLVIELSDLNECNI